MPLNRWPSAVAVRSASRVQIGQRRQPRTAFVDVVAGMDEGRVGADAAIVRAGGRICVAAEHFRAEFQELVGRRKPAHLHAVIAILVVEEGAIGQRRVGEPPIVGVALVEIADARKEAPGLEREAARQILGADVGFFDRRLVVFVERKIEEARQNGIDVGA